LDYLGYMHATDKTPNLKMEMLTFLSEYSICQGIFSNFTNYFCQAQRTPFSEGMRCA